MKSGVDTSLSMRSAFAALVGLTNSAPRFRHRQRRNDDDDESLGIRSAGATLPDIKRRRIGKVGLYFTFHQQLTRSLIVPTCPPCRGVTGRPSIRSCLRTSRLSAFCMALERPIASSTASSGKPRYWMGTAVDSGTMKRSIVSELNVGSWLLL